MTFKLKDSVSSKTVCIPSCAGGEVIELEKIKDNIFSSKILGEGYGVIPSANEITAPFNCVVRDITNGGQTLTLKCENGLHLLIHMGINLPEEILPRTNEHLYCCNVSKGDMVSAGTVLGKIDFESALSKGFDPTVVFIITNSDTIENFNVCKGIKSIGEIAAKYSEK